MNGILNIKVSFKNLFKLGLHITCILNIIFKKTEANYEIAEKVVTLKDELKQLEDEYNEKYTRRSNEINEIITIELRCESLMRQNEELKGKLVQVENERDQTVEKLITLKKSNTQLESNVRQANSEIAERQMTCEYVKKRENELNEEINALKQTKLTLETSLNEEKKKNQNVLVLLTNLKKEAQEQQEKFDLKSYRQQKFINDLKGMIL
jgi:chromosome segregation ATPase